MKFFRLNALEITASGIKVRLEGPVPLDAP